MSAAANGAAFILNPGIIYWSNPSFTGGRAVTSAGIGYVGGGSQISNYK